MTTIQDLAGQLFDAFAEGKRDNGETFFHLKDDAPEWMGQAVYAAHGDMMPNDWSYSFAREAAGFIHDAGDGFDPDEFGFEFADDVTVYNVELLAWVSSHLSRMSYVDDAICAGGAKSLADALMAGQATERREVFDSVVESLSEIAEAGE